MPEVINPGAVQTARDIMIQNPSVTRQEYGRLMAEAGITTSTVSVQWAKLAHLRDPEWVAPEKLELQPRSDRPVLKVSKSTTAIVKHPMPRNLSRSKAWMEFEPEFLSVGLRPQDERAEGRDLFVHDGCDIEYCRFTIYAPQCPGVYVMVVDGVESYVGKADDLRRRMRDYGNVSPRHTSYRLIDGRKSSGQRQKCRLNGLLHDAHIQGRRISIRLIETADVVAMERTLIAIYQPEWNIQK